MFARHRLWVYAALLFPFFALSMSADSISIYKNQIAPGPIADAVRTGVNALQDGDLTKAELSFRQALKLKPSEPHALVLIAEVDMRRGKPTEALPYLRLAVDKNPNSAVAEEALGRYLALEKDYAGAESALLKSVKLDPKWIDAQISLGDFYLSRGKSSQALAAYRSAVETDPANSAAHFNLAKALEATHDDRSAETEFRNSTRLTPQAPAPHFALGDLLSRTGKDDEGLAEYQAAAKLDPQSGEPYIRIGMAQQKKGRTGLAEAAYRKALELQPNQLIALNNLTWIDLQKPQKLDEARSFAQKTVQLAPNAAEFLDTLGWVYHVRGDNQQAIVTLKKGIASSSQDPEIHYHLAVAYEDNGNLPEALDEMNRSLALKKDFPELADARKRNEDLTKRVHR